MGCKNREKIAEKSNFRKRIRNRKRRKPAYHGTMRRQMRIPWTAKYRLTAKKKALCGNRRPSNDCLPYENSSKDRCRKIATNFSSFILSRCDHKDKRARAFKKESNNIKKLKAKSFYHFFLYPFASECNIGDLIQKRKLSCRHFYFFYRFSAESKYFIFFNMIIVVFLSLNCPICPPNSHISINR
jgi:hypothetical protein